MCHLANYTAESIILLGNKYIQYSFVYISLIALQLLKAAAACWSLLTVRRKHVKAA